MHDGDRQVKSNELNLSPSNTDREYLVDTTVKHTSILLPFAVNGYSNNVTV